MNLTFIMSETRCFVNARRASSTLYPCLANSQTGHAIMADSREGFNFVRFETSPVCRSVPGRGDAVGTAGPIYMRRRAAGASSSARREPQHRRGVSAVRANKRTASSASIATCSVASYSLRFSDATLLHRILSDETRMRNEDDRPSGVNAVRLLLYYGASPDISNALSFTARDIARMNESCDPVLRPSILAASPASGK